MICQICLCEILTEQLLPEDYMLFGIRFEMFKDT